MSEPHDRLNTYLSRLGPYFTEWPEESIEREQLAALGPSVVVPLVDASHRLLRAYGGDIDHPVAGPIGIRGIELLWGRATALLATIVESSDEAGWESLRLLTPILHGTDPVRQALACLFVGGADLPPESALGAMFELAKSDNPLVSMAATLAMYPHSANRPSVRAETVKEIQRLAAVVRQLPGFERDDQGNAALFLRQALLRLLAAAAAHPENDHPFVRAESRGAPGPGRDSRQMASVIDADRPLPSASQRHAEAIRWQYAVLRWDGIGFSSKREIEFTHQTPRRLKLGRIKQLGALAMLGDNGWELVSISGTFGDGNASVSTWRRPLLSGE